MSSNTTEVSPSGTHTFEASPIEQYIVVFKDNVPQKDINEYVEDIKKKGGSIRHRYDGTLISGFSVKIPHSDLTSFGDSLQKAGVIDYIEPDSIVTIQDPENVPEQKEQEQQE